MAQLPSHRVKRALGHAVVQRPVRAERLRIHERLRTWSIFACIDMIAVAFVMVFALVAIFWWEAR